MKRIDLLRHLQGNGCKLVREGGNHSVFCNRDRTKLSTVPRHREVKDFLAKKICRDLGIPSP
jgi:predicted RNA binding protein YcfA (HicA-like mRNA interferase family)